MKKSNKMLTLLLTAALIIQMTPLTAMGDAAVSDPNQAEEQENSNDQPPDTPVSAPETETETEKAPETESVPVTDPEDGSESQKPVALAVQSVEWSDATVESFQSVTDGMTVDRNYLVIRFTLTTAPDSVEATVDGVTVEPTVQGSNVSLPVELLNGYHTFAFRFVGGVNTLEHSFSLHVKGVDTSYPELNVEGASGLVLGTTNEILITGQNLHALSEITVDISMSGSLKVEGVDIADGFVGMYSWFRGDLKIVLEVYDASAISGEVLATVRVKAPATVKPEDSLSWTLDSATVTPAPGESLGQTEHFLPTVTIPETKVEVISGYTIEGSDPCAILGMKHILTVKNNLGEPAANVSIYAVNGRKNTLLGQTDENGNFVCNHFTSAGIYQLFAEDENGVSSFYYSLFCYESVGPEDGSPYSILFNGIAANGKTIAWMSNAVATGEDAVLRLSSSEDMADAVLYNGNSSIRFYKDSLVANRVNSVTVSDLTPGAVYYYQVGDGTVWSEVKAFTVKQSSATTTFAVIGDMGQSDPANLDLIMNSMVNSGLAYDFLIQTGNAVTDAQSYESWMNASDKFAAFGEQDVIHALGQSEASNAEMGTFFGAEAPYRHYLYGNVFVCVINYTEDEAALADMLDDMVWDAKNNPAAWQILVMQQAPYSTDADKADSIAARLVPVMAERAGIDLVLSGGEGCYARTESLRNGAVTEQNGVTYVVCGSVGERGTGITADGFAVTNETYNALYLSVTADEHSLRLTVYNVSEDGETDIVDTLIMDEHYICPNGEHIYRFGVMPYYLVCDICNTTTKLLGHVGLLAVNDGFMYAHTDRFVSGWQTYAGKTYYFSPATFFAVNGVQVIDGVTYVFKDYVLVEEEEE